MYERFEVHQDNITNLDTPRASLERQIAFFSEDVLTRHLLDAMPGVVFVLNKHHQIIFANRTLYALLGTDDAADLIGKRPGDVLDCRSALEAKDGCGTGLACRTCGALMAILSGLNGQKDVQECLLARNCSGGAEHLTLRIWSSPVVFGDEQFTVLAGMDISHERRRLALERTFFHDILNLIGSIRGYAELMDIDRTVDPVIISQRIQSAAQRVIDEIDAQRLLLAAEKGELQANPRILGSRSVIDDLVTLYSGQDVSRDRQINVSGTTRDFSFISDSAILGRILGNMLKNALEACQPGEKVTVGVLEEDQSALFWVHNREVIPAEHQPRVFQRDFSTKGSGRGLGTYGMKMLASFLDGEITFSSLPGQGTTFRLKIPSTRHA